MNFKFCFVVIVLIFHFQSAFTQTVEKKRAIILTDIEADPDDTQSFVRLFLYANSIDIKGLVATTSVHQKTKIAPESIERLVQAYGKVYANLTQHEAGFPTASHLSTLIKKGRADYGMNGVGEGKDSEGSDWIIRMLEENDARPLWISVWGGANTLAQSLYKIKKTKTETEVKKLVAKLRVYTISDQDDSGLWIRKNFPELFYIVSPGGYQNSTWIAITQFVNDINNETVSNTWLAQNIQQDHGPLGAMYPDVAYGMEGDTPSWLSLIPNGLNELEHPNWGGWGGRYELYTPGYATLDTKGFTGGVPVPPEPRAIWTNAVDNYTPYRSNEYGRAIRHDTVTFTNNKVTLWRWRDDFQNDFAARMDWCLKSYTEANHPPIPAVAHAEQLTVKSGESFTLDATGTTDPDGDNLSYIWFHYPEAGSYKNPINFNSAENLCRLSIKAPDVDKKETAHFILKVTDKGTPRLSRYKRIIVTIHP